MDNEEKRYNYLSLLQEPIFQWTSGILEIWALIVVVIRAIWIVAHPQYVNDVHINYKKHILTNNEGMNFVFIQQIQPSKNSRFLNSTLIQ